jgi:amidase
LRFAVKDLIDVAGAATGAGNPDWLRTHEAPAVTAPSVGLLLSAGASLAGKTVTDELAFSLEGENAHYGTPLNPACPDCLPGGSSSGSAVAVAAGLVDFALGTDTGGSVRVPASFCGIYGMRPTHGRISLEGVVRFAPSYDTIGWFARDGALLRRVGAVLLGTGDMEPPHRLLIAEDAFELAGEDIARVLREAATRLGASGTVNVFGGEADRWLECYRVLQGAEIWSSLGAWISDVQPRLGSAIAQRFADAAAIDAQSVKRYAPLRQAISDRMNSLLPRGTALVLPTAPCAALPRNASGADRAAFYRAGLTLTSVAGHAGLPQITLPGPCSAGAPVGLSVIGARGTDDALLALAAAAAAG